MSIFSFSFTHPFWRSFSSFLLAFLLASPLMAQWEPEVRLTYNDSASWAPYNNAKWIAAGPSGDVHVVWQDYRESIYPKVYYKRSTNFGASWSPDTPFVDYLRTGHPSVAVSGNMVHVVWGDMRDGNPELYYKRSTNSGFSWSPDTRLTFSPGYDAWLTSLAASESGVHVAWREDFGPTPYIGYMGSTNSGASWSPETLLAHPSLSALPSVAAADTAVHVVWSDFRGGVVDIYYKRSSDNGVTWSPDIRLTNSQPGYGPPGWQTLAVSGPMVHVVWSDVRDTNSEIYYKRSTNSGLTWGPDVRLTYDSNASSEPSICTSGSNIHLVWWNNQNRAIGVSYKSSTDNGLTWGPDTSLTPLDSIDRPCVAVSGSVVHVAWMDYRDGNWEIYYKRNPTGNSGVEVLSVILSSPYLPVPLSVVPNPFASFAAVPGHEKERFALYDVSGRKVSICKGNRIGVNLPSGIYFLSKIPLAGEPEGEDAKPLRIVKLR